jgi:hypothetical protein
MENAGGHLTGPPLAGPPLAGPPLAGPPLAGPPLAGSPFHETLPIARRTQPPGALEIMLRSRAYEYEVAHTPESDSLAFRVCGGSCVGGDRPLRPAWRECDRVNFFTAELVAKRLGLLRELLPQASRGLRAKTGGNGFPFAPFRSADRANERMHLAGLYRTTLAASSGCLQSLVRPVAT